MDAFVIIEGDGVGTQVISSGTAGGYTPTELQTAIDWMYSK